MKRLKSLASGVLLTLVLALSFVGCGSEGGSESSDSSSKNAAAESAYPTKSIQVIVPAGAGGDTDMNARLFGKYLEKELGQPVVIVNTKGGGGIVGMEKVKSSDADGHTVLFFHTENMVPKIAGLVDYAYDAFDLCGIGVIDNTTVLATHKDTPYKTLKELVDYAKKHPGEVELGMQIGGYSHIIGIALEEIMGIDLNFVDIGGNSAKTAALQGHKTDVINTQYGLTKDYFTSGNFVSLGLTSPERNDLMSDVPTTAEQGYDLDFNKFFFYAMPKGTPEAIVNKFSTAMKKVTENPEYQAEAKKIFVTPKYMGPQEAKSYMDKVYEDLMQYKELFLKAM